MRPGRYGDPVTSVLNVVVDRLLRLPGKTGSFRVQRDLPVPMPDGVELLADRYAPPGDDPAPVVLDRTPYGRDRQLAMLYGVPFASRSGANCTCCHGRCSLLGAPPRGSVRT